MCYDENSTRCHQATFCPFRPEGPRQEMTIQFSRKLYHNLGWFYKGLLKKFYPIHKTAIRKKHNAVQIRTQQTILEILWMFQRPYFPMLSSWRKEVAVMSNSLWWSKLSKQDSPWNYESREILESRWTWRGDLAEKTLQWEPSNGNPPMKSLGIPALSLPKVVSTGSKTP